MKYISYFLSWCACVFGSAILYDLPVSVLRALYIGNRFYVNMPLTVGVYIILFTVGMLMPCFLLALSADGIASIHYVSEKKTHLAVMIINQIAASVIYVAMGHYFNYNKRCYYTVSILSSIINELREGTITDANRGSWMLLLTIIHMLVFTFVAVLFYLIRRKERIDKYINAIK